MFNDFKESLKIKRLSNTTAEQEIKNTYKAQNLESYNKLANNAESLCYIHNVIAAILLGLNKANPESQFYIPYRIKAPESKEKKLNKRLNKSKVIYDEEQNSSLDIKPSFDDIALKIIIEKPPLRCNFKDKELSALAKQYEKNKHILSQMQEFSEKLIKDEFSLPENREYKFEVSKKEYYEKCRELILHTTSLFHKESTNILEKFDNSISYIENKLKEHNLLRNTKRKVIKHGQSINLGSFRIEFIKTNHSIQDASARRIIHFKVSCMHHNTCRRINCQR